MDASHSTATAAAQPRRTHLKRLSLSVSSRDSNTAGSLSLLNGNGIGDTPDKTQYAIAANSPSLLRRSSEGINDNNETTTPSNSPLHRPLGASLGSSGRRQRPMSMYSASSSSPMSGARPSLLTTPQRNSYSSNNDIKGTTPDTGGDFASSATTTTTTTTTTSTPSTSSTQKFAHPLASPSPSTTTFDASVVALSPASATTSSPSVTSPTNNPLNDSTGRRSILGRSAHARRQSSISYARSPANDSFQRHSPNASLAAIRDVAEEGEEEQLQLQQQQENVNPLTGTITPSRRSIIEEKRQILPSPSSSGADGVLHAAQPDLLSSQSNVSPSNNEMNIGPGARSSELLTFIAKKERRCLDLREELKRNEAELEVLKRKWEAVIQREMAASASSASVHSPASSNISPSQSREGGLFSSLASTLNASTSSNASTTNQTIASPSPKPSNSGSSRRLLTSRHSISVASPSNRQNGQVPYLGGSDLSPQTSPLDALSASASGAAIGQGQAGYDVQKIAKSWFGGVMKSASTVLDTLAPPPPNQNDLQTVTEEDEEAEDEHVQTHRQRQSAGHPNAAGSRSPHNRESSTATAVTTMSSETSSPSSSCEDGQFSSNASRSSSVSSLHSDNVNDDEKDITPVATPILPPGTPRAQGEEEKDLWALSGDFENDDARQKREDMERNRIDLAKGSPRKQVPSPKGPPIAGRSANHGRRRSTAFELGGAWGAMVGKKWNEMASTLSASETFKTSSKRAMGLMEDFERSLSEAITPDPNAVPGDHGNTQLTLVNGELIPTGNWSPASSPRLNDMDKSLPSGIGGPSGWSALLGRGRSAQAPKSPQSGHSVAAHDAEAYPRMQRSLLDEDEDIAQTHQQYQPAITSPTSLNSAQERIQASRAKHAKRMSLPVNVVSHAENRSHNQGHQTQGLGLANVNESDEDDSAWGW